jgi:hypothetical protein
MTGLVADGEQRLDVGIAGASARRMEARERRRRETRQSGKGPAVRVLELLRGGSAEERRIRAREKRWAVGATGEEMLAESLGRRCPKVFFLHDRRLPGGRANIDHIAVAPTGIYVIDAKRYRGKIEVRKRRRGVSELRIAGRNRTKLISGMRRQVEGVQGLLTPLAADVPVHGSLCFLHPEGLLAESGLPLLRRLSVDGFRLFYPRALARQLNKQGSIDGGRARELQVELARRLPSA